MGQAVLSVRIDEDIKRRFDLFCADVGMNATVAVNMFARAVLREKRIPFEITGTDDPFYSVKNQTVLAKSIEDLGAGRGLVEKTWEELQVMESE
ncbi:MAG: type II toxin-antitoxin system RelB/DinJ family antitoxin [Spirochaetaceae bacterium]|jgi:DNA-damage-inducible protein J|nr:type II toxin-antitoxin system RelB/DinJ family antitoxin [Spirochaetaceae bacterium]